MCLTALGSVLASLPSLPSHDGMKGNTMARTQTKQPALSEPKANAPMTGATGAQDNEADTGNVSSIKETPTTSPGRSQTNRPSLMALVRKDDSQKVADK